MSSTRPFRHINKSSHTNKYLYNSIQKYGLENFILIIFALVETKTNSTIKSELANPGHGCLPKITSTI